MKKDDALLFLDALGVRNTRVNNDWINFSCPLAKWRHEKSTDRHPSAGLSISDEGMSTFLCYTCQPSAKPSEFLLHSIWLGTGHYPSDAATILGQCETFDDSLEKTPESLHTFDLWKDWVLPKKNMVIPRPVVDMFPLLGGCESELSANAIKYLSSTRGINPGVINLFNIRFWEDRNALLFPLTNHKGETCVIRVRTVDSKQFWTLTPEQVGIYDYEFPKIKNTGAFFGLHLVNWARPVMIVEGELDCMRLYSLGFTNVIASCTANIAKSQVSMLCGTNYILGFDNDAAGRDATNRAQNLIKDFTSIRIATWLGKDAGDLKSKRELDEVLGSLKIARF